MYRVRSVFRSLLFLAVIAAFVWSRDVRADPCKPDNQTCATNMSCCNRNCAKPIFSRGRALFGLCCPSGDAVCGNSCVNLSTDNSNCGACGKTCAANETCVGRACTCVPNCAGKECGGDGCGNSCGSCTVFQTCDTTTGTCVPNPSPSPSPSPSPRPSPSAAPNFGP